MIFYGKIYSRIFVILCLLFSIVCCFSCHRKGIAKKKVLLSLSDLNGIRFTEVYRRMKNGLSFNDYGYQLEPEWKISFLSDDSANIYSPRKKRFLNFPLTLGYDSIFNTANAWLKVQKKSKDSLVVEILKAADDSVEVKGAKVYMTFYADKYVKDVLHSDTAILRRPSRADTAFIKKLVAKANRNPDSAFAARQPVVLTSKSPLVTVVKKHTDADVFNYYDNSDDYLEPEYDIRIYKAYTDFTYSFTILVDQKGGMHYGKPLIGFPDSSFKNSYIQLSSAIMNSYLKYYLSVLPGSTLGMKHTSMILVNVNGRKEQPGGNKASEKRNKLH
jgi:hypothetical protein